MTDTTKMTDAEIILEMTKLTIFDNGNRFDDLLSELHHRHVVKPALTRTLTPAKSEELARLED